MDSSKRYRSVAIKGMEKERNALRAENAALQSELELLRTQNKILAGALGDSQEKKQKAWTDNAALPTRLKAAEE